MNCKRISGPVLLRKKTIPPFSHSPTNSADQCICFEIIVIIRTTLIYTPGYNRSECGLGRE